MDLLRFTTAGSVDDGKSTLIGRLLYDTKSIFEDQLEQIEASSRRLGEAGVNLALLTDGLRAEREQKITIDVAYRYFATPRRSFIIADTPGHVQYTRNMVTGASTADLAVILIDARKGVQTQSRRHAFLTSLLGIPQVIVAVNKMDLVDWSEAVFESIREDFEAFAGRLDVAHIEYVPLSALLGDNVVHGSEHMPWYGSGPLLERLEAATAGGRRNTIDFRFPVQTVIRPDQDYRGFAGTVESGGVAVGDEVVALPSGFTSRVSAIDTYDGALERADTGRAVVLRLADELDVSRGDMLVRRRNQPLVLRRFEAYLCWMAETPLNSATSYVLRHTTREVQAFVDRIEYRVDVDTLHRESAATLELNDIARIEVTTAQPLFVDPYRANDATGSFVLIDPHTNATVAAGMVRGEVRRVAERAPGEEAASRPVSPAVTWEPWNITRDEREARNGHAARVIWLTGPSGAGKSTLARALERRLWAAGRQTMLLDGDQVRHGLNGDLGFSPDDRRENVRRVGEVAKLFFEQGCIVLCSFVSPYAEDRARVRALLPEGRFTEVLVTAGPEALRARDPKGLYAAEERGDLDTPGLRRPHEAGAQVDVVIETDSLSIDEALERLWVAVFGGAQGSAARAEGGA